MFIYRFQHLVEVGEGLVDVLNHLPEENEQFTSLKNIITGKLVT